jgi:hypothetical protein
LDNYRLLREEFATFLRDIFKEPGKYNFDETSLLFNSESRKFRANGLLRLSPLNPKILSITGMIKNLNAEEELSIDQEKTPGTLQEIIICGSTSYQYLIRNNRIFDFAKIRDAQYHMALYELLAELNYKHVAILKKTDCFFLFSHG